MSSEIEVDGVSGTFGFDTFESRQTQPEEEDLLQDFVGLRPTAYYAAHLRACLVDTNAPFEAPFEAVQATSTCTTHSFTTPSDFSGSTPYTSVSNGADTITIDKSLRRV